MEIAFFDLKPEDKEFLKTKLPDDTLHLYEEPFSDDKLDVIKDSEVVSIRDRSRIGADQAAKLKNLKLIVNRITGYDNVAEEIYREGKCLLCNVPAYGAVTVAEYVFAHILNLSRKLSQSILERDRQHFHENKMTGFDLNGKTIGIVGTGRIGFNVARIARGFDMNIVGFDLYENYDMAQKYHLQYKKLDELLSDSDIISLNLPLTEKTRYIINKKNIGKIKRGAILINTGRGALVDVDALIKGLDLGVIAAAGLDVLEGEDTIFKGKDRERIDIDHKNMRLLDYDNVFITPHNAFNTREAYQRIMETTIKNIIAYKEGKPINLIQPI